MYGVKAPLVQSRIVHEKLNKTEKQNKKDTNNAIDKCLKIENTWK